jgi:fumarylpyruvate hydrolase
MKIDSSTYTHTIDPVLLPVLGTNEQFPVRQIYCVGRNYADHAIEMGHDPSREPPFFFMKPAYAVLAEGGALQYPSGTNDLHHEVELVVALKGGGVALTNEAAKDCVFGFGVGIDLTRRDLQGEAKSLGRPWESGKVFHHSAPCSALSRIESARLDPEALIELSVNGETRQKGRLSQMIWRINEIIVKLSELFPLAAGDLIFTGTPAGVGPVVRGDALVATIDGVGSLQIEIV